MPEAVRSLALAAVLLAAASPVFAQPPLADRPDTPQFMPRFDFRMSAASLAHDDNRFTWDTHWAGDFDLVDYVYGRMTFLGDYQAVLGDEFRPFDPYQSNYYLAVSGSVRSGPHELAFVFHHLSRHLGDRPKRESVAYNAMLGRYLRHLDLDGASLDVRGDLGRVIARAHVDYTWTGNVDVTLRRPVSPRFGLYGRTYAETFGVDEQIAGRGQQYGGRLEGGVRIGGSGGAVELFGGYERVVDADPLDRLARRWAFAGFRLLGR